MRVLNQKELRKRGCRYCADSRMNQYAERGRTRICCINEKCPYRELDATDDYNEWVRRTTPKNMFIHMRTLMRM